MDGPVMVTVYCPVYNHEKYLRKCLDGFVSQKTTFRYEVIVHDDASTDHSADIIREYAQKYPDLIRPIYQTENQWSKNAGIVKTFVLPIAKGKYFAMCDGDDYWCDEDKLQLQFDAMEAHPDCCFCVHKVRCIHESGEPLDKYYPSSTVTVDEGTIYQEHYFEIIGKNYNFHTSSYFRRIEDVIQYYQNPPEYVKTADVGDNPALLYWGLLGNVYYIDRVMSCYRELSIGSWSSRRKKSLQAQLPHNQAMIRMYDSFNEFTEYKYEKDFRNRRRNCYLKCCLIEIDKGDNARILCKKENRDFMERRSWQHKLYIFCKAYAPILANWYEKIKGPDFRDKNGWT